MHSPRLNISHNPRLLPTQKQQKGIRIDKRRELIQTEAVMKLLDGSSFSKSGVVLASTKTHFS